MCNVLKEYDDMKEERAERLDQFVKDFNLFIK